MTSFARGACALVIASAHAANLVETLSAAFDAAAKSSQERANTALESFRSMAGNRGARGILCGPIHASDVLTLGPPLPGIYIDRSKLELYNKEPARMAGDFDELVYPVLRNRKLCGAEVLQRTTANWKLVEFRDAQFLVSAQASQFYIQFTGLDAAFIGRLEADRVTIAPLTQFRGMKPVDYIPIEAAFSQLLEAR